MIGYNVAFARMGTRRYPYVQIRYDPRDPRKPKDGKRIIAYRACPTIDGVRDFGEDRPTAKQAHRDAMNMINGQKLLPAAKTTLRKAVDDMLEDLVTRCRPGTIDFYRCQSKAVFATGLDEKAPLASVTGRALQKLIQLATKGGFSTQTIRHYRTFLSRLFSWCAEPQRRLWVGENPVNDAIWPEPRRARPDVLTAEEMADRLEKLRVAQPEDYDLVAFMAFSGLRRAETARLHTDDIDMPAGVFWTDGKTREEPAPITAELRPFLEALHTRANGGYLVRLRTEPPPGKGDRRRWEAIDRVFRRWKDLCNDRRIHPHTLRHALATNMIRAGVDLGHVQTMLRHASVETTKIYVHLVAKDLHRAVAQVKYLKGGKASEEKQG